MRFANAHLFLLAMATLTTAQRVVSKGIFLGKDTSVQGAAGASIYRDLRNHAVATASILKHKGQMVDYVPSIPAKSKSEARLSAFVQSVAAYPGFRTTRDTVHHLVMHGGLDNLQEVIRSVIGHIGGHTIAENVREMIPTSLNNEVEEFILSVLIVHKPKGTDRVTIQLVGLALTLVEGYPDGHDLNSGSKGDYEVILPDQLAVMHVQEFEVLPRFLAVNARELARSIWRTSVAEYVQFFRSASIQGNIDGWFDFGST